MKDFLMHPTDVTMIRLRRCGRSKENIDFF